MKEIWKVMLRSYWKRLRFMLGILRIDVVELPKEEKDDENSQKKRLIDNAI